MDALNPELAPELTADLRATYEDLHAHPELSGAEHRTAGIAAERLRGLGYDVREGVGGTGVVAVLANGSGPTVLVRADSDALPVTEETGLPYASTVPGVMHACGHDVHVTCLLGAAEVLAASRAGWSGTLVLVVQPAEETVTGAAAMVADGVLDGLPPVDVVLGQHVAPIPAGVLGLRPGPAFAAADSLRITLHGRGGHGSRPEACVDPVVMAASTVLRLQTVVSRETSATEPVVLTVGSVQAGTKANVIPERAELLLSVRTYDAAVRERVLAAIERIAAAEAAAAGAPRPPEVEILESAPTLVNDLEASARTRPALESVTELVVDPGVVTGSEDVGVLATAAGAPLVFWLLGGADPALFAGATGVEEIAATMQRLPSNHSPHFAPVPEPTLAIGTRALVAATRTWLAAV